MLFRIFNVKVEQGVWRGPDQFGECVYNLLEFYGSGYQSPAAGTDSCVFALCAKSCSAGTDSRMMRNFFHISRLLPQWVM